MAAVRKYIQVIKWYGELEDIVQNNTKFLRDLERLCIDSGLTKSNRIDNMNTDTIDIGSWFTGNKNKRGHLLFPTNLYFDMSGENQLNLPVTISFSIGFQRGGTTDDYPYHPTLLIRIECGGNVISTLNNVIDPNNGSPNNTGKPVIYDDEFDSFIYNSDGFLTVNICNMFSTYCLPYGNGGNKQTPLSFGTFNIQRSFDDTGLYNGENINVFLPHGESFGSKPIQNIVMYDGGVFSDTSSTFIYFNKNNSAMEKGKIKCHSTYHVFNDSSIKPSPNIFAISKGLLKPAQEIDININNSGDTRFISLNNGNANIYSIDNTPSLQNRYLREDVNLIVRFGE